jgi:hypothetical protein
MIETVGCMMAYFVIFNYNHFTPRDLQIAQKAGIYFTDKSPPYTNLSGRVIDSTDQTEALAQAQGMFYMSIFLMQCFNMFAVKAKLKFPFGKAAIGNKWNFVGALAGAVLAAFVSDLCNLNVSWLKFSLILFFFLIHPRRLSMCLR